MDKPPPRVCKKFGDLRCCRVSGFNNKAVELALSKKTMNESDLPTDVINVAIFNLPDGCKLILWSIRFNDVGNSF